MLTVRTLGVVSLAHDAKTLSEKLRKKKPKLAEQLDNAHETLVAAGALILRHEEASVPMKVAEAISFVSDTLRDHPL